MFLCFGIMPGRYFTTTTKVLFSLLLFKCQSTQQQNYRCVKYMFTDLKRLKKRIPYSNKPLLSTDQRISGTSLTSAGIFPAASSPIK